MARWPCIGAIDLRTCRLSALGKTSTSKAQPLAAASACAKPATKSLTLCLFCTRTTWTTGATLSKPPTEALAKPLATPLSLSGALSSGSLSAALPEPLAKATLSVLALSVLALSGGTLPLRTLAKPLAPGRLILPEATLTEATLTELALTKTSLTTFASLGPGTLCGCLTLRRALPGTGSSKATQMRPLTELLRKGALAKALPAPLWSRAGGKATLPRCSTGAARTAQNIQIHQQFQQTAILTFRWPAAHVGKPACVKVIVPRVRIPVRAGGFVRGATLKLDRQRAGLGGFGLGDDITIVDLNNVLRGLAFGGGLFRHNLSLHNKGLKNTSLNAHECLRQAGRASSVDLIAQHAISWQ